MVPGLHPADMISESSRHPPHNVLAFSLTSRGIYWSQAALTRPSCCRCLFLGTVGQRLMFADLPFHDEQSCSPGYDDRAIRLRPVVIYGAPVFVPVSLTRSALTCTLLKLQQTSRSYSDGWFGSAVGGQPGTGLQQTPERESAGFFSDAKSGVTFSADARWHSVAIERF